MLPALPQHSIMIFLRDYTHVRIFILQDDGIYQTTHSKVDCLLEDFSDIMSFYSSDIGYTKLINMDIENDPNLPSVASNHTHYLLHIMNVSKRS